MAINPDCPADLCYFWSKYYNPDIHRVPWDEFFDDFVIEFGEQYAGPEAGWLNGKAVSHDQESLFKSWLDDNMDGQIAFEEIARFVSADVGLYGSFLSLVGAPDMSSTPLGLWQLGIKEAQAKTLAKKPVVEYQAAKRRSRKMSLVSYQDKFTESSHGKATMNVSEFKGAMTGSEVSSPQ